MVKWRTKILKNRKIKRAPAAPKNLNANPSPLPKNAAGFGWSRVNGGLYRVSGGEETFIPEAALRSLRDRRKT